MYRRDYEAGLYCHLGDDRAFSLLELPWPVQRYPSTAPDHVRWMLDHGTQSIIAHPERHGFFHDGTDRLHNLVDAGAWLQITVDSLIGKHGSEPQEHGWDLVRDFDAVVLATDAHGPNRCSGLSVGYRGVSELLGEARAQNLKQRAEGILHHLLRIRNDGAKG